MSKRNYNDLLVNKQSTVIIRSRAVFYNWLVSKKMKLLSIVDGDQ